MKIINSIITQPIWGVLTGLVGFYFGQRFNLWRDRRKEFNERSESIFVALNKQIKGYGGGVNIGIVDSVIIEPYISVFKRRGFRTAVKSYNESSNCSDGVFDPVTGGGLTTNEAKVQHYDSCAKKLIGYLKRR